MTNVFGQGSNITVHTDPPVEFWDTEDRERERQTVYMGEELGNYVHQNMGEELGNYVHQNIIRVK